MGCQAPSGCARTAVAFHRRVALAHAHAHAHRHTAIAQPARSLVSCALPGDYKTGKTFGDRPPMIVAPEMCTAHPHSSIDVRPSCAVQGGIDSLACENGQRLASPHLHWPSHNAQRIQMLRAGGGALDWGTVTRHVLDEYRRANRRAKCTA
jgi:hypothetical protein